MKKARVTVHWTPSVSTDVVVQRLSWDHNGVPAGSVELTPEVVSHVLGDFDEKDLVAVSLAVNDGTHDSDPVQGSFSVPDLNVPAAATDLSFTYEVVDVEV